MTCLKRVRCARVVRTQYKVCVCLRSLLSRPTGLSAASPTCPIGLAYRASTTRKRDSPYTQAPSSMDATQVLQTVLSIIQSGGNVTAGIPADSAGRPSTSAPDTRSLSLPHILMTLLGISAVRDWIKLFLIGALLEVCRRFSGTVWSKFVDCFWVTASFELDDDASGERRSHSFLVSASLT